MQWKSREPLGAARDLAAHCERRKSRIAPPWTDLVWGSPMCAGESLVSDAAHGARAFKAILSSVQMAFHCPVALSLPLSGPGAYKYASGAEGISVVGPDPNRVRGPNDWAKEGYLPFEDFYSPEPTKTFFPRVVNATSLPLVEVIDIVGFEANSPSGNDRVTARKRVLEHLQHSQADMIIILSEITQVFGEEILFASQSLQLQYTLPVTAAKAAIFRQSLSEAMGTVVDDPPYLTPPCEELSWPEFDPCDLNHGLDDGATSFYSLPARGPVFPSQEKTAHEPVPSDPPPPPDCQDPILHQVSDAIRTVLAKVSSSLGLAGGLDSNVSTSETALPNDTTASSAGALSDLVATLYGEASEAMGIVENAEVLPAFSDKVVKKYNNKTFALHVSSSLAPSLSFSTGTASMINGVVVTAAHVSRSSFIEIDGELVRLYVSDPALDYSCYGGELPVFHEPEPGEICTIVNWHETCKVVFRERTPGSLLCFESDSPDTMRGASGSLIFGADGRLIGIYVAGVPAPRGAKGWTKSYAFSPNLANRPRLHLDDIAHAIGPNGIWSVSGVTGAGKTMGFVPAMVRKEQARAESLGLPPRPFVMLQPRVPLTVGQSAKLDTFPGITATYSHGEEPNKISGNLHVTTTQRLFTQIAEGTVDPASLAGVLVDEAHTADSQYALAREYSIKIKDRCPVIFLTATGQSLGISNFEGEGTPFNIDQRPTRATKKFGGINSIDFVGIAAKHHVEEKIWIRAATSRAGKQIATCFMKAKAFKGKKILFMDKKISVTQPQVQKAIFEGKYDVAVTTDVISVGATPGNATVMMAQTERVEPTIENGVETFQFSQMSYQDFLQALGRVGRMSDAVAYYPDSYKAGDLYTLRDRWNAALLIRAYDDKPVTTINEKWHGEFAGELEILNDYSLERCRAAVSSSLHPLTALWETTDDGQHHLSRVEMMDHYSAPSNLIPDQTPTPLPGYNHKVPHDKDGKVGYTVKGSRQQFTEVRGPPVMCGGTIDEVKEFAENMGPYEPPKAAKAGLLGTLFRWSCPLIGMFLASKLYATVGARVLSEPSAPPSKKAGAEVKRVATQLQDRFNSRRHLKLCFWHEKTNTFVDATNVARWHPVFRTPVDAINATNTSGSMCLSVSGTRDLAVVSATPSVLQESERPVKAAEEVSGVFDPSMPPRLRAAVTNAASSLAGKVAVSYSDKDKVLLGQTLPGGKYVTHSVHHPDATAAPAGVGAFLTGLLPWLNAPAPPPTWLAGVAEPIAGAIAAVGAILATHTMVAVNATQELIKTLYCHCRLGITPGQRGKVQETLASRVNEMLDFWEANRHKFSVKDDGARLTPEALPPGMACFGWTLPPWTYRYVRALNDFQKTLLGLFTAATASFWTFKALGGCTPQVTVLVTGLVCVFLWKASRDSSVPGAASVRHTMRRTNTVPNEAAAAGLIPALATIAMMGFAADWYCSGFACVISLYAAARDLSGRLSAKLRGFSEPKNRSKVFKALTCSVAGWRASLANLVVRLYSGTADSADLASAAGMTFWAKPAWFSTTLGHLGLRLDNAWATIRSCLELWRLVFQAWIQAAPHAYVACASHYQSGFKLFFLRAFGINIKWIPDNIVKIALHHGKAAADVFDSVLRDYRPEGGFSYWAGLQLVAYMTASLLTANSQKRGVLRWLARFLFGQLLCIVDYLAFLTIQADSLKICAPAIAWLFFSLINWVWLRTKLVDNVWDFLFGESMTHGQYQIFAVMKKASKNLQAEEQRRLDAAKNVTSGNTNDEMFASKASIEPAKATFGRLPAFVRNVASQIKLSMLGPHAVELRNLSDQLRCHKQTPVCPSRSFGGASELPKSPLFYDEKEVPDALGCFPDSDSCIDLDTGRVFSPQASEAGGTFTGKRPRAFDWHVDKGPDAIVTEVNVTDVFPGVKPLEDVPVFKHPPLSLRERLLEFFTDPQFAFEKLFSRFQGPNSPWRKALHLVIGLGVSAYEMVMFLVETLFAQDGTSIIPAPLSCALLYMNCEYLRDARIGWRAWLIDGPLAVGLTYMDIAMLSSCLSGNPLAQAGLLASVTGLRRLRKDLSRSLKSLFFAEYAEKIEREEELKNEKDYIRIVTEHADELHPVYVSGAKQLAKQHKRQAAAAAVSPLPAAVTTSWMATARNFDWLSETSILRLPYQCHMAGMFFHHHVIPRIVDAIFKFHISRQSSMGGFSFGLFVWFLNLSSAMGKIIANQTALNNWFKFLASDEARQAMPNYGLAGLNLMASALPLPKSNHALLLLANLLGGTPSVVFSGAAFAAGVRASVIERVVCAAAAARANPPRVYMAIYMLSIVTAFFHLPVHVLSDRNLCCLGACAASSGFSVWRVKESLVHLQVPQVDIAAIAPGPDFNRAATLERVSPRLVPGAWSSALARFSAVLPKLGVSPSQTYVVGFGRGNVASLLGECTGCTLLDSHYDSSVPCKVGCLVGDSPLAICDAGPYDDTHREVEFFKSLHAVQTTLASTRKRAVGRFPGHAGFLYNALCLTPEWVKSVNVVLGAIPRNSHRHEVFIEWSFEGPGVPTFEGSNVQSVLQFALNQVSVPPMPRVPIPPPISSWSTLRQLCRERWASIEARCHEELLWRYRDGSESTGTPMRHHDLVLKRSKDRSMVTVGHTVKPPTPRKYCESMRGVVEGTAVLMATGKLSNEHHLVPNQNEGYQAGILKRWTIPTKTPPQSYVEFALEYHEMVSERSRGHSFQPKSWEELPGYINGSSSFGTTSAFQGPLAKHIHDPALRQAVDNVARDVIAGNPVDLVYYSMPKGNEKLAPKKLTRSIVAANGEVRIADLQYLGCVNDFELGGHGHPSSTSENCFALANRMGKQWERLVRENPSPTIFIRETSNWDGRQGDTQLLLAAHLTSKFLEKGNTHPDVLRYQRNRVKMNVCVLILDAQGNVRYKEDFLQITGGIDTSVSNKHGTDLSTIWVIVLITGKTMAQVRMYPLYNEGDDNLAMLPDDITAEQWAWALDLLEQLGYPASPEGAVLYKELRLAPFCSHYVVKAWTPEGDVYVQMRDWNIIAEKFMRTIPNYGDNVTNRSLCRALTATYSLMARYWFLPVVRVIFEAVVAAVPKDVMWEIPHEDRQKVKMVFGATSPEELDVVKILRKGGIKISRAAVYCSHLDEQETERFNVPEAISTAEEVASEIVEAINRRTALIQTQTTVSVWAPDAVPTPGVLVFASHSQELDLQRLTLVEGPLPRIGDWRTSIRASPCPAHVIDVGDDVTLRESVIGFIAWARDLRSTGFSGDTLWVASKGKLLARRRAREGCALFETPLDWIKDYARLEPFVPAVPAGHSAESMLAPDVLRGSFGDVGSLAGVVTSLGVVWPPPGSLVRFGGAVFPQPSKRPTPYTLGQVCRTVSASLWIRMAGIGAASIADSVSDCVHPAVLSTDAANELYPMAPLVDALTPYGVPGVGKYSSRGLSPGPGHVRVRWSTNGPGSDVNSNRRALLIAKLRAAGVDAGLYRVDNYSRPSGRLEASAFSHLMLPAVPRSEYFGSSVAILADGFGSPYELGPLVLKGYRVLLFSDLVQYSEAFLLEGQDYVKVPMDASPSQVASALDLVQKIQPRTADLAAALNHRKRVFYDPGCTPQFRICESGNPAPRVSETYEHRPPVVSDITDEKVMQWLAHRNSPRAQLIPKLLSTE